MTPLTQQVRHLNANRAMVTRIKRNVFEKKYPTMLVRPDGSTVTVKYHAPRQIIKVLKIRF